MILSCRDVTRLISDSMDRSLPLRKRLGVRLHLMLCRFCSRYERQLRLIRDTVRRIAASPDDPPAIPPETLSPEARERIRKSLGGS
ncbi:MAG: hypothetical protein Kow00128_01880 [Deltaproteobacteria bacterium]